MKPNPQKSAAEGQTNDVNRATPQKPTPAQVDRGEYVPMLIQQKIEDMILYGNKALLGFPRAERYAMAADIKRSMYALYRLVVAANKKYFKKTTLQDADVELAILRNFIRLAANKELRYLPINKYENWAKMLDEIGRMLGGWIKAMKQ